MRWLILALVVALALGGVVAYATFLKPFVDLPGTLRRVSTDVFATPVSVRPGAGPNATPQAVVFPNWSKKEPVNILLLGLDYRPEDQDTRSDTMVIVHIDPANKTALMVSIPRDLWLEIPGHGEGRINSAYQLGESNKADTPGGGPGLAMATVEQNFGIPIHYFAQVDFKGFERIVDTLGGITVDVPRPLADNEYPLGSYSTTRIYVPAGLQHMDGRTALEYARSRHADSDLGRNQRQQQVLLAIRQQGLTLDILARLNDLLNQLSGTVKTDLSLLQVGSLAQLAREIDHNSIQTFLINEDYVHSAFVGGADVLVADWPRLRPALQRAFADPRLAAENARISVQNGTTTSGVARTLGDLITKDGFEVVDLVSAENQGSYPRSVIIDYTGGTKPRTVERLASILGLSSADVKTEPASSAPRAQGDAKPIDIVIIAGDDRLK